MTWRRIGFAPRVWPVDIRSAKATSANVRSVLTILRAMTDCVLRLLNNDHESPNAAHLGVPAGVPSSQLCWRCEQRNSVPGGTVCEPCGAWLRGETDLDPIVRPDPTPTSPVGYEEVHYYGWWMSADDLLAG